jgi:hypothetical protein
MAVDVEAAGEVEPDAAGAVDELPRRLVAAVKAAEALGAELVPVDVEPDEVDVDEVDAAAAVELVDRSRL